MVEDKNDKVDKEIYYHNKGQGLRFFNEFKNVIFIYLEKTKYFEFFYLVKNI